MSEFSFIDSKKRLAIKLSELESPTSLKLKFEQYLTPSEEAARILWMVRKELSEKLVADFGTGHGILGIGALLLGAKKVFFVEIDEDMIVFLEKNLKLFGFKKSSYEIFKGSVVDFKKKIDVVIMNPPFGTHHKGYDDLFIKNALRVSKKVYTLLSALSRDWLVKSGYYYRILTEFDIRLPFSKVFHTKTVKTFRVIYVVLES